MTVRDADHGVEEFRLGICPHCRSGAIDDPPDDRRLGEYYDRSYYGRGDSKFFSLPQAMLDLSTRLRAKSLRALLGDRPSPRVLDIGCGRGALLAELARLGARGIGLERTALESGHREDGFEIRVGELGAQGFADASFDAVVLWHVLEHLRDPHATLVEVGRVLRTGGLLLLAVPNNASWQARLFGKRWFHLDAPRHLHFFGHAGLLQMLRRQGYKVVQAGTLDLAQNLYGFIQSALNCIPGVPPNRLYRLMRSNPAPLRLAEMLVWAVPASLLLPLALMETACGAMFGQGGCSTIVARRA